MILVGILEAFLLSNLKIYFCVSSIETSLKQKKHLFFFFGAFQEYFDGTCISKALLLCDIRNLKIIDYIYKKTIESLSRF